MQDEIFGPILPILRYSNFSDALATIKGRPRPLAGFIFSQNQIAIDRFISSLSFGGGAVNQSNVHVFIVTMPFGGVGASGMGSSYGKHGFDSLTHAKSILVSPPDVSIDHLFPPYTMDKVQALRQWLEF
jgi:acyl-CoA reductase-like NAD-dependent aldehyde dehydrogenase